VPTDTVRHHAAGVDLLVHEAMQPKMLNAIQRASVKTGQAIIGNVVTDIQSYHTLPEQAARIAKDANVGQLVLYHVIPPLPYSILEPAFLGGSRDIYAGPIILGQDGMLFSLLPNTSEIKKAWLLR
jgi:ribonuclease Z